MQKKTFVFWGLAIIVCLSLLVGCSKSSVTTSSSTSPTQNTDYGFSERGKHAQFCRL